MSQEQLRTHEQTESSDTPELSLDDIMKIGDESKEAQAEVREEERIDGLIDEAFNTVLEENQLTTGDKDLYALRKYELLDFAESDFNEFLIAQAGLRYGDLKNIGESEARTIVKIAIAAAKSIKMGENRELFEDEFIRIFDKIQPVKNPALDALLDQPEREEELGGK